MRLKACAQRAPLAYDGIVNRAPVNLQTALELHRVGRLADAEAMYRQALVENPNNPAALHLLGVILHQNKRSAEAVHFIQRAIALQPNISAFHNNLGEALRDLDRCEEAIASYQRALRLKPAYPEALNNMGGEYGRLANMRECVHCLRQCIALKPKDPDAHWNLSVALLLTGEWGEGWNEFEWRLLRPESPGRIFPKPHWAGQPLVGKTLLLWSEQGFGDMIQFFRYVAVAKRLGAKVILDVQTALVPLLASQNIADAVIAAGTPIPPFDYHLALMSMPRVVGTTILSVPDETPYIRPAPARAEHWKQRLSPITTRKIGLAWAGRPEHPNDHRRSLSPMLLRPLVDVKNVTYFTVQPRSTSVSVPANMPLLDVGVQLTDFADTAGLLSQLDLLITVDTSVAHLAGAMGRPVWLLLPFSPDWRWLMHRTDTPWYPSMTIFRQKKLGDWPEVIQRVCDKLERG
jgi:Tfp pilus assembly protein PilF